MQTRDDGRGGGSGWCQPKPNHIRRIYRNMCTYKDENVLNKGFLRDQREGRAKRGWCKLKIGTERDRAGSDVAREIRNGIGRNYDLVPSNGQDGTVSLPLKALVLST